MTGSGIAKRDAFFAALAEGPQLMGIVNVTPDSFSDGGRFVIPDEAIGEARRHVAEGAAIIDLGAESTRPGFTPVDEHEEIARLQPVLQSLIDSIDIAVSIDTTKASVAELALEAGAVVLNDQWGLQGDPDMAAVAATHDCGLALMHNGTAIDPGADVIDQMRRFFDRSLAIADDAGIKRERIVLDPGIGFAKTKAQNIRALGAGVVALREYGLPILIGVSRKSLFAELIGAAAPQDRLIGTIAANLAAFRHGARLFRVHDCKQHREALVVTQAITDA